MSHEHDLVPYLKNRSREFYFSKIQIPSLIEELALLETGKADLDLSVNHPGLCQEKHPAAGLAAHCGAPHVAAVRSLLVQHQKRLWPTCWYQEVSIWMSAWSQQYIHYFSNDTAVQKLEMQVWGEKNVSFFESPGPSSPSSEWLSYIYFGGWVIAFECLVIPELQMTQCQLWQELLCSSYIPSEPVSLQRSWTLLACLTVHWVAQAQATSDSWGHQEKLFSSVCY